MLSACTAQNLFLLIIFSHSNSVIERGVSVEKSELSVHGESLCGTLPRSMELYTKEKKIRRFAPGWGRQIVQFPKGVLSVFTLLGGRRNMYL